MEFISPGFLRIFFLFFFFCFLKCGFRALGMYTRWLKVLLLSTHFLKLSWFFSILHKIFSTVFIWDSVFELSLTLRLQSGKISTYFQELGIKLSRNGYVWWWFFLLLLLVVGCFVLFCFLLLTVSPGSSQQETAWHWGGGSDCAVGHQSLALVHFFSLPIPPF